MADSDVVKRLKAAAQITARQAKANASWSKRIPASIRVLLYGNSSAYIYAEDEIAPQAKVFELGMSHPLNYPSQRRRVGREWGPTPKRPFLKPAAEETADEVTEEISKVVDDMAHEEGFK